MGNVVNAACRQALTIGLDISGSVDAGEYRLQMDGLAGALLEPEVQKAIMAMPDAHIRLMIFEWGGINSQRIVVHWTEVHSQNDLETIASTLLKNQRPVFEPSTALGTAMLFGATALQSQTECWRRTMDISGDGESNTGPRPRDAGKAPILADITINALVIGADAPPFSDESQSEIASLSSYFRAEVIRGPEAFVQAAIEFSSYQDAMARKLLKELQTRAVGALTP